MADTRNFDKSKHSKSLDRWQKIVDIEKLRRQSLRPKEIALQLNLRAEYVQNVLANNEILDVPEWFLRK